jgi:hypothetical protein
MVRIFRRQGMKAIRIAGVLLTLLFLFSLASPAHAQQDETFQIPSMDARLTVNADGTIDLEYQWTFYVGPNAIPLDYVDVGMPQEGNMTYSGIDASANGVPISDIVPGTNGFRVYLGSQTIQAGQQGSVYVKISGLEGMLYIGKSYNNEEYAHFQFTPTWFDSQYVVGYTQSTVTFVLPPGTANNEGIYDLASNKWPGSGTPASPTGGNLTYVWSASNTSYGGDQGYVFGASFPSRLVAAGTVHKAPFISLTSKDWATIIPWSCGILCVGAGAFTVYGSAKAAKKRKLQYLPPKIALEGNGIKRGLTPVEVGILMEQPMDKILTMTLFSTIKKNAATVVTQDPLKLTLSDPLPDNLYSYEIEFLRAMQKTATTDQRLGLQDMMINLVKSISEKMKGFSRKETLDYYQDIMKRAWEQIKQAGTPEVKSKLYEETMDWTMLDTNYDTRTQEVFGPTPIFVPLWWGRYDPAYRTVTAAGGAATGGPKLQASRSSSPINMPALPGSTFAASITKGSQSFSSKILGNVADFTSGVTSKTNPIPVTTSSSGRGGFGGGSSGGHSCVCACACACAGCACACAGGGR